MQRLLAGQTTMTDAIMHWQRYAVNSMLNPSKQADRNSRLPR